VAVTETSEALFVCHTLSGSHKALEIGSEALSSAIRGETGLGGQVSFKLTITPTTMTTTTPYVTTYRLYATPCPVVMKRSRLEVKP
jgi:hypothetical protein